MQIRSSCHMFSAFITETVEMFVQNACKQCQTHNLYYKSRFFFFTWTICKVFIGSVTTLLLFHVLAFLAMRHVGS